jgi:hypothetical protein
MNFLWFVLFIFAPAILVWLFVTIFKDQLKKDPTKKEYIQMITKFTLGVLLIVAFAISIAAVR